MAEQKGSAKDAFVGFIVLAVLFFIVKALFFGGDPAPKSAAKLEEDQKWSAIVMAEKFVKNNLKAPSTAKFPLVHPKELISGGKNIWSINSYVDAQNSFGAQIRNRYRAKVMDLGNDKWKLLDLQFYN